METNTAVLRHNSYADQSKAKKACILTVLFSLFAFLGWVCETFLFLYLYDGEFVDRGLLTLPFCPLYGFGALFVYAVLRTPQSGIWKKLYSKPRTKTGKFFAAVLVIILYAIVAAVLASVVEYLTGLFFDKVFGIGLWNYDGEPDNVGKYVNLRYSATWGVLCVTAMGGIWYPLMGALAKAETSSVAVAAVILLLAISCDFVFNLTYLHTRGSRFLPFDMLKILFRDFSGALERLL